MGYEGVAEIVNIYSGKYTAIEAHGSLPQTTDF